MNNQLTQKKISIIVPVYNIEKYVERCITSLVRQTYSNIEIIIVNDGSTDTSREKIQHFNDDRIVIINKENGGLSSARNAGLEVYTGDYVLFVDGDDYLDKDALEKLIGNLDADTELLLFPYCREYGDSSIFTPLFEEEQISFDKEQVQHRIYSKLIGPARDDISVSPATMDRLNTAWGKLYRKDLIGKIRFTDTQKIGPEDCWFNIQVLRDCKKAKYVSNIRYHYEKTNDTSLLHKYNANFPERRWTMYKLIKSVISDQPEYKRNLANRIYLERFGLLNNIWLSNLSEREKIEESDKILNDSRYKKLVKKIHFNNMPTAWKIFYKLCDKKMSRFIGTIFKLYGLKKNKQR